MRKALVVMLLISVISLTGCIVQEINTETTESAETEAGNTSSSADVLVTVPEGDSSQASQEETSYTETVSSVEASSSEEISDAEETESSEQDTSQYEENNISELFTEVDLTIEMPEKNGTMVTDSSSGNKFIKAVNSERKIDKDKLVAVYSVPESGQNYVFEFYDDKGRDADDLRRVFLLDGDCDITGVAATDVKEKEGISSIENWFCMNVLIKEIIFPAISESIS